MNELAKELFQHMDTVPCDIEHLAGHIVSSMDAKDEELRAKTVKEMLAKFGVVLKPKNVRWMAGRQRSFRQHILDESRKNIYVQLGWEFSGHLVTVPQFIEKFREIASRSYIGCLDIRNSPSELHFPPDARPFLEQESMLLNPMESKEIVNGIAAQVSYAAIRASADMLGVLPELAENEEEKQIRKIAVAKAGQQGRKRIFGDLESVMPRA